MLAIFFFTIFAAYKPKFAEPKKTVQETADRYDRDAMYSRSRYDDRDERYERRSGAPGGYPYSDRDRGILNKSCDLELTVVIANI